MLISDPSIALASLPMSLFVHLQTLFVQMNNALDGGSLLVTETDIKPGRKNTMPKRFALLVSPQFSALLQGTPAESAVKETNRVDGSFTATEELNVALTFEPEAIAAFIRQIAGRVPTSSPLHGALKTAHTIPQTNNATLQTSFTGQLIATLSSAQKTYSLERPEPDSSISVPVHPALSQPIAAALVQQIEQERLLNQVMSQIRRSLELPVILQTAVEQVRSFLKVDRLVIYQIHTSGHSLELSKRVTLSPEIDVIHREGVVAYESRASDNIPSVLNLSEICEFYQECSRRDKYRQGFVVAVNDVEQQYASIPCLLEFLETAKVRAKLIVPILVHNDLWGLLIAHRCDRPYRWRDNEQRFLQQIAEHMAVAISQAQLYAEVQQQKQTLEERVAERTQDLQDALLAAQTANRAKTEFLASVSHELRTPLTCVIGMSSTLLRWSKDSLDDRQKRFLQTIHDSGDHLLELINDLLELSQLEAGKAMLNLREVSLTTLAQQSLKAVEDRAVLAGVHLELDSQVDEQSNLFIADAQRVQHILLNLLSNAVKFTPRGGRVTLRVQRNGDKAIFQVKDTGIGIPEQQQPMLFQKFQQLDSSYQRQYGGLGVGLALTKQLVDLHGGWIDVDSVVGVGSIFTVHLPMLSQTLDLGIPSAIVPIEHPSRIVLVESHEESANLICDILNAAGYQLVWMVEGSMAVSQIEILQPAAALISTRLPDCDGYDIIQQLRLNPATRRLKIIGLVSDDLQECQRCLVIGADGYLAKPINPEQALHTVNAILSLTD